MSENRKRLAPPHIQLGYFWNDFRETEHFGEVLEWLLADGYKITPRTLMVRIQNGRVPWFSQIAMIGSDLPEEFIFWRDDCSLEAIRNVQDAAPVMVHLTPTSDLGVECDLAYSLSFDRDAPRAIELVASGAALDLMENVGADQIDAPDREIALRTQQWLVRIFQRLCDEMTPCYAGCFWESPLLTPSVLLSSDYIMDWTDIFVSHGVISDREVLKELNRLKVCSVSEWATGSFIERRREASEFEVDCQDAIAILKKIVSPLFPREIIFTQIARRAMSMAIPRKFFTQQRLIWACGLNGDGIVD